MRQLARDQIRLAAARAEADHADLAAGVRLRAQEVDGSGHIPEHLLVEYSDALTHLGDHRLVGAVTDPEIEARRHGGIDCTVESAGDPPRPPTPATPPV